MTALLVIVFLLVTAALAWRYRRRLVRYLPTKRTMLTVTLVTSIVVLAVLAVLPDLIILLSALKLLSPLAKTILLLAAAVPLIVVGCSKQQPQPHKIHWHASESGFSADSPPPDPQPKESP